MNTIPSNSSGANGIPYPAQTGNDQSGKQSLPQPRPTVGVADRQVSGLSSMAQAALDKAYRRELSAWVAAADASEQANHQHAARRIDAYLKASIEQRKLIDLSCLLLSTLPPLPADVKRLHIRDNQLTTLPSKLPPDLQELSVGENRLTALPKHLPPGLKELWVDSNKLTALPEHLPPGLWKLTVRHNNLTALLEHLPPNLQELYVSSNKLSALPEHLPPGLRMLMVSDNNLTALPEHLPPGLKALYVEGNQLSTLPANLPPGLQTLDVRPKMLTDEIDVDVLSTLDTHLDSETLLALMRTNTSITSLYHYCYFTDADSSREIEHELMNNKQHPERLVNAAVALDLLTRFAFTTSAQTGDLIRRVAPSVPLAGQSPERPIPAELHQILAANCPKAVLAVLAGMVAGAASEPGSQSQECCIID